MVHSLYVSIKAMKQKLITANTLPPDHFILIPDKKKTRFAERPCLALGKATQRFARSA